MFNRLIHWSLSQAWVVILLAAIFLVIGGVTAARMPIDVFPEFTPPQVIIQTEAAGLSPEEVESLVTFPLESQLNGTANVEAVRSSSAIGLSVITVVFNQGTDIFVARQLVQEKLTAAISKLPKGTSAPTMSPITSPVGDILKVAVTAKTTSPMDTRTFVDWTVRNRLLAIPGVARVLVLGGSLKQYQVAIVPSKLAAYGITLDQVSAAVNGANVNSPGGFWQTPDREYLIRGVGRVKSLEDIANAVITTHGGTPVLVRDIAEVKLGAALKRGDGSLNGEDAVLFTVTKTPWANTLDTTHQVEKALAEVQTSMPADVKFTTIFRQANFIETSVNNVLAAMRDGGILVVVILIIFLLNWRTAFISIMAIPLSLLAAILALRWFNISINSMTLGGLTIAIGIVVDDAIVDVENVYRRLRENEALGRPQSFFDTIYHASVEIRTSIVYATWILLLVFVPLFALSGVEGRIFMPLGFAYVVSVATSLLVAVTVTPALCFALLAKGKVTAHETKLITWLKARYSALLDRLVFPHPSIIIVMSVVIFLASLALVPLMGKEFLPEFQEGNLIIALSGLPGTSLAATVRMGKAVERTMNGYPEFKAVGQRAGRAEGDDDAGGVNFSEVDAGIGAGRPQAQVLLQLRKDLGAIPGVSANIGSFIAHRLDEVLSGTQAAIAVKIFGPDLGVLRTKAAEIKAVMGTVKGIEDLLVEPQMDVDQLDITFDRPAAARYGLSVGDLAAKVQTAFAGQAVSQVLEQGKTFDLYLWFDEQARSSPQAIATTLIDTPTGARIPLGAVATVQVTKGPNTINRENVSRRIVVQSNFAGRDLGSIIAETRAKISQQVNLPAGYFVEYGGQFESQERATKQMLLYGALALVGIFALMYMAFRSVRSAILVMANLPLAVIGGIISVFLSGGVLSVASLVGFITLFGISTRNGILLVAHYNHLAAEQGPIPEGKDGDKTIEDILRNGALDRLSPVLMTALAAALGMAPLALVGGTGREIEQPLAMVVLGGMVTSTALTLLVIPALYWLFGKPAIRQANIARATAAETSHD
jgi:CzcA family heavy metal efflux pump